MQIKNNLKILFVVFLSLFVFKINLYAEEFDITAKEILVDKDNETLTGKGTVEAIDSDGNIIIADTIVYKKSDEFLMADGNVKITDEEGNLLLSKKATFDKINELITTYDETELILIEGYELLSKNICNIVSRRQNLLPSPSKIGGPPFQTLVNIVVSARRQQYALNKIDGFRKRFEWTCKNLGNTVIC